MAEKKSEKKKKKTKKAGGSKFLPFGKYFLILLVLASQVILAYQIVDKNYGSVFKVVDDLTAPEEGTYLMEELIVNPSGSNGQRFLVVEISLELHDAAHIELIDQNIQRIKHNMLEVLSSRTVGQLSQLSEREKLRSELAGVTNKAIGKRSVRNLYYTKYVMQ
ncbi:flagellar basal body-associated FliL family protein [Rhodohalobacter sp. 8-1]|uniref:flagellar basal body-associated FliL family protein n=1 Tax=Rhodohalobacter sp. 8-1 TaxID=3131972 RepID=UPI0030EB4D4D